MQKLITFYDRSLRLWTAYFIDEEGNQISSTGYATTKQRAIDDIEFEPTEV